MNNNDSNDTNSNKPLKDSKSRFAGRKESQPLRLPASHPVRPPEWAPTPHSKPVRRRASDATSSSDKDTG